MCRTCKWLIVDNVCSLKTRLIWPSVMECWCNVCCLSALYLVRVLGDVLQVCFENVDAIIRLYILRAELGVLLLNCAFDPVRFGLVWWFMGEGIYGCTDWAVFLLYLQYYMRTGTCKFGASCKYNHPKQGGSSSSPVPLNYYGYPLRLVCIYIGIQDICL